MLKILFTDLVFQESDAQFSAMQTQPESQQERIFTQWPRIYALAFFLIALLYLYWQSELLLGGLSFTVFMLFLWKARSLWQPLGRFGGVANLITLARLLGILLLLLCQQYLHAYVFFVIGILILIADGLDGYYARKYKTASDFGDFFDKETDAFFVLAFCVILYEKGLTDLWVIYPGVFRYVFVLLLYLFGIENIRLGKSFRRQFAGMWFMGTIMGCFVLPEQIYMSAMLFATAVLTYSFLKDIYLMLRSSRAQG